MSKSQNNMEHLSNFVKIAFYEICFSLRQQPVGCDPSSLFLLSHLPLPSVPAVCRIIPFFPAVSDCKKTCSHSTNWVWTPEKKKNIAWAVYKTRVWRGNDGSVQDPERSGQHFTMSALGNKVCGIVSGAFLSAWLRSQCPALQLCVSKALHHKLLSLRSLSIKQSPGSLYSSVVSTVETAFPRALENISIQYLSYFRCLNWP